jgi:hypothetical protein
MSTYPIWGSSEEGLTEPRSRRSNGAILFANGRIKPSPTVEMVTRCAAVTKHEQVGLLTGELNGLGESCPWVLPPAFVTKYEQALAEGLPLHTEARFPAPVVSVKA